MIQLKNDTRMKLVYEIDLQFTIFVGKGFHSLLILTGKQQWLHLYFILACMNFALLTCLEFFSKSFQIHLVNLNG